MIPADLNELGQEALWLLLLLSLPILAAALLSGLLAGVFQAITKMTEPTVDHVARASAVLMALIIAAPWIAEHVHSFASHAWILMQSISR